MIFSQMDGARWRAKVTISERHRKLHRYKDTTLAWSEAMAPLDSLSARLKQSRP